MSRSPTDTHSRVSHNVCLFQENSGYRKWLRKAGQKEAILWPNLWPSLRSACTDFSVEATSIHHILAKILEQLWPEIGRLLLRPRVPDHVGSTTEAEIRLHWLRLRLTRQRHETAQRWYRSWGRGPVLSMATFGWNVAALRPQKP